ncbi:GlcG/HbpS family heme-binding protein [Denitromonas halophila]|uniref:Heme-binding protein n=1 Tax=Denitromonas halophila TaxID=1629404 RepID=A0A557QWD1_9RHOO|nr:heme-binding protein [Denitromonas halophila]TVO57220.1 heme-binding protein [Denitromonas halophila]
MASVQRESVVVTQAVIGCDAAAQAVSAAVAHARELGVRINVAVADSGGNLAAFLRMPGAFVQSIDIAIDKAYTAAGFGFPTGDWMKVVGHDEGMKLGFSARPRLVVFGGGLPIRIDGVLIGGVGVSGASEEQDEACARAALAVIGAEVTQDNKQG